MRQFICLVTAASVLLTGIARLIKPRIQPQFGYGYRSTLAMKNPLTWAFAQRTSAKALIAAGVLGLLASEASCLFIEGDLAYVISLITSAGFAALTVAYVEARLAACFDADGRRRKPGGGIDGQS